MSVCNSAPLFLLDIQPILRCWQCKKSKRGGDGILFACMLFPPKACCSVNCARCFIETFGEVCERERSQCTVELTEWCIDEGVDLMTTGSCVPWWSVVSLGTYSRIAYGGKTNTRLEVENVDGNMCWGCFQDFKKVQMRPYIIKSAAGGESGGAGANGVGLGQFHSLGCMKRFLKERIIDVSLRNRVLYWVKQARFFLDEATAAASGEDINKEEEIDLGCDWRLHTDFGGELQTLPLIAMDVQHPIENNQVCVMWKTTYIPQIGCKTQVSLWSEFKEWIDLDFTEMDVRLGVQMEDKKLTAKNGHKVSKEVKEILMKLLPDDPISVWHEKHKNDPKAGKYVLFRPCPLPFETTKKCMGVAQAETGMEEDDDI